MKVVLQRVSRGKVTSHNEVFGEIDKGLFLLIGIGKDDTEDVADKLVKKIVDMRVMADDEGKMNLSIKETTREVLLVSQFTLYSDTSGGRRPSFINAADPEKAKNLYEYFAKKLEEEGLRVGKGNFGNYMNIDIELDGPVTIIIEG